MVVVIVIPADFISGSWVYSENTAVLFLTYVVTSCVEQQWLVSSLRNSYNIRLITSRLYYDRQKVASILCEFLKKKKKANKLLAQEIK